MTLSRAALTLAVVAGVVVLSAQPAAPPRDGPAHTPAATGDVGGRSAASAPATRSAPAVRSEAAVHEDAGDGPPRGVPGSAYAATVTSITDGDTLRVDSGGSNEPVRLLELDTPEVTGDCGAAEATAALRRLAPAGSRLWLEADVEDRDRYGRLLRYLWRDDGTLINEALVRQGWARATLYPPNDRYWPLLEDAERSARERGAGLWGRCGWGVTVDQGSPATPGQPAACDPNYSGCVPVHPPDVDCDQVTGTVTVLGRDPHRLDGDGDGRAC